MTDYYDAFHSDEATRLRSAIYSALEDYVRYFESLGFQIRRSWIEDAHYTASHPARVVRQRELEEEEQKPTHELEKADEAIIDAVRTILANGDTAAKAALVQVLYSKPSSSSTAANALT